MAKANIGLGSGDYIRKRNVRTDYACVRSRLPCLGLIIFYDTLYFVFPMMKNSVPSHVLDLAGECITCDTECFRDPSVRNTGVLGNLVRIFFKVTPTATG